MGQICGKPQGQQTEYTNIPKQETVQPKAPNLKQKVEQKVEQLDEKFVQAFSLLELQKIAMAETLPYLKRKVLQQKKQLRGQGLSDEEIQGNLIGLEREYQEKLNMQEKEQLIELNIIRNRQEPNEEFDDYYENELMKDPSVSQIAKSNKEIETALRTIFAAEPDEEEDDFKEIKLLNLTQMRPEQFNNFMFFYYSNLNKEVYMSIQTRKQELSQQLQKPAQNQNEARKVTLSDVELTNIMNNLPKQQIAQSILKHLGLKEEKFYDIDVYLQKLYYVFTDSPMAGKGQENIIDALVKSQQETLYYILNQDDMDYTELEIDPLQKYKDVDIKLVSQGDPGQLELTDESLLLDFFTKYFSKMNPNFSSDELQSLQESTPQAPKEVRKSQLARVGSFFHGKYNIHNSVIDIKVQ